MQEFIAVRANPAAQGATWFSQGFRLFRRSPGTWIGIFLIYLVLSIAISSIPLIGWLGAALMEPILTGGLMLGCAAQLRGENLKIEHLFKAFDARASELLLLGLIYLGLILLASIPAILLLVLAILEAGMELSLVLENQTLPMAPLKIALAVLLALFCYVPVLMGYWLAPALLVERDLKAWQAFRLSFRGCLHNIRPALVYGLVVLFWTLLALVPLGLGLLVLAPVLFASTYMAYQHIFKPDNNLV